MEITEELDTSLSSLVWSDLEEIEQLVQSTSWEDREVQSAWQHEAWRSVFSNQKSLLIGRKNDFVKSSKFDEFEQVDNKKMWLIERNSMKSTHIPNSNERQTAEALQKQIQTLVSEWSPLQENYVYGNFLTKLLAAEIVLEEKKEMKKLYYIEMMKMAVLDAYYEVQ